MNTQTLLTATLQDKSIIVFEDVFNVVKGGYYCKEAFEKQWEIVDNLNLCLIEEASFINDLTDLERECFRTIIGWRLSKQQEMDYTTKYDGIVPHVANKIELGTILYSSWGYDQTNIDYYCVVEMSKSMCKILPMKQDRTDRTSGDMSEYVIASKLIDFGGELLRKRVQTSKYNNGQYLRIESFANAYLWDGKEKYQSHYH